MGNQNINKISNVKSIDYKWYFRADDNPYDDSSIAKWSPYSISDNNKIETAYIEYSLSKGNYDAIIQLNQYEINFKSFKQYNLQNVFKQRPVMRSQSCPENIIRIQRFDQNFESQKTDIVQIDDHKLKLIKDDYYIEGYETEIQQKTNEKDKIIHFI